MSDSMASVPQTAEPHRIRLADGRILAYATYGATEGHPVLCLHGTPGSRLKFALADGDARRLGLRLIAPDRWGYGSSTAPRHPTLSGYGRDMAELADRLGLARPAILAISGGGPYGTAAAAALGPRAAALALVGPVGPIAGVPAGRTLGAFHTLCFRVLPAIPGAIPAIFGAYRAVLSRSPRLAMRILAARAGHADRAMVCGPALQQSLAAAFRCGLEPGVGGTAIDMRLFGRPWAIAFGDIGAPARIWLGSADRNVPLGPARHLARALGNGALVPLEGHGHYWIAENTHEVLAWIAGQARAPD